MNAMKTLKFRMMAVSSLVALMGLSAGWVSAADSNGEASSAKSTISPAEAAKQRKEILAMRDATLKRLYKLKPGVRDEIAKADGYAVFNANQANIVLLVAGTGDGVLVDNATGQNTFMTMKRLGTGPGLGFKKYKQVLVLKSRKLVDTFKTVGADVTASGDATIKLSEHQEGKGVDHAVSLDPMVSVYQLTDRGVLLQANWGGMAYLPDADLNGAADPKK